MVQASLLCRHHRLRQPIRVNPRIRYTVTLTYVTHRRIGLVDRPNSLLPLLYRNPCLPKLPKVRPNPTSAYLYNHPGLHRGAAVAVSVVT